MKNKFMFLALASLLMINFVSAYTDSVYIEDYELEIEYDNAQADDIFTLTLTLINDDNEDRNFTIEFDEDDPFEFVNDDSWKVFVASGDEASETFRIEVDNDADSKKYDLDFNLDDGDDDYDDNFEIKVSSDSIELVLGEISSSPKKILPGDKEVELTVVLKNSGDYSAEDLVATLILSDGFSASSSYSLESHVGDLDSGDTTELTFYFDVDEKLGDDIYDAQLKLEYEDDGESEISSLDLNLPVFTIPQFEITSLEIVDGEVYPGSTSKIKVGIQNIGGETGEDVSLKVYERSDQPFGFTEKSAYVGTLDVGETGYAVFEFDTEKSATIMQYLLDFQVRSISGEDVIVDDLTYGLSVSEKDFNIENYLVFIVLGFVILLILIFVMARRL